MGLETTKLTIRLPKRDVEFAKAYAKAHGLSVTEVIDRYLRRMRTLEQRMPSPELEAITGLVPSDVAVEEEHRRHLRDKHR
jgi:predicted DNA binding CopG/RHH family protein